MARLATLTCCLVVCGCAAKRVPEPAIHDGNPHISWSISVGKYRNPERTMVCESDPPRACNVSARKENEEKFADVHLYYHPATAETTYTGTIQIGFFEGSTDTLRHDVDVTVKPGDAPKSVSVLDRLTTKPGVFMLTIDLAATVPGGPAETIRRDVQVVVN